MALKLKNKELEYIFRFSLVHNNYLNYNSVIRIGF